MAKEKKEKKDKKKSKKKEGGEKKKKSTEKKSTEKKSKKKDKEEKLKGKTFNANDIAEKADIEPREIKAFFDAFRRKLEKMKVGSQIRLPGICNFMKIETKPRKSRNPRTGEEVDVPAKKKIKVRVSNNLKNL